MTRPRKIDAAPESVILRSGYSSDGEFRCAIIAALIAGRMVRSAPDIGRVSPADLSQGVEVLPGITGYRWVKEDAERFGFFRLEKA